MLLLGTGTGLRKFATNRLPKIKGDSIMRLNSKKPKQESSFGDNKYVPKSVNQFEYRSVLEKKDIDLLFCIGPAGTGKTLFACQHSIKALQDGKYKKIIITRPTVSIEEDLGFLPGTIKEKMQPYTMPIFDIFQEYFSKREIDSMIDNNIIEIAPLGYLQGRTFKESIIIADEMQNSSPIQMFMLLTRIGDGSKMIITGDPLQTINENNGLIDIIVKLNKKYENDDEKMEEDSIRIIRLNENDIQRHHIVAKINALYMNK
jgi:phosphate starvation-inducible PhoH-like protein